MKCKVIKLDNSDAGAFDAVRLGPATEVVSSDYVQTIAEAIVVLGRKLSEKASHEVVVTRPDHWARPGDTVHLIDRDAGIIEPGHLEDDSLPELVLVCFLQRAQHDGCGGDKNGAHQADADRDNQRVTDAVP